MEDHFSPWKLCVTLSALVFLMKLRTVDTTTFTVANSCGYTVWPGLLTGGGQPPLSNGGFALQSGKSITMTMPTGWSGRLWGRTGCNFSSDGVGKCASGDCAGSLQCSGAGATPPVTLVEFTLQGNLGTQDFYDVSLVDGYNLPVTVTPSVNKNGTCGVAGCSVDINKSCPSELEVVVNGAVVSCKSACTAFQTAQYCCSGEYADSTRCKATTYSQLFKSACPNAYSYAFDDPSSLFTCSGADYSITFCPTRISTSTTAKKRPGILWVLSMGLLVIERNLS